MGSTQKIVDVLNQVKEVEEKLLIKLEEGNIREQELYESTQKTSKLIDGIKSMVRADIYDEYQEFFDAFKELIERCKEHSFLLSNVDNIESCLSLFVECIEAIICTYYAKNKKCACCGYEVMYEPLSSYYSEMKRASGDFTQSCPETLNRDEYLCPICGSSDRDRLMISYLKELQIDKASEGEKLLQIAPASSIEHWIHGNCTKLIYHSTDLFMDYVTFKSDIQDMNMIEDGAYDYFICSHVLEHVEDDRKAMSELYRILANDGIGIFLVPIDLNTTETDEEWGLSEEENWRRFGQGDHCRRYARQDLIDRLKVTGFCVNELGKEHFGEEVFNQCGLLDTSILYVLTKGEHSLEDVIEKKKQARAMEKGETPLVSVIMPSYNHEEYVAQAIESVLNQTYPNIELLIADDGSTDKTQEVILRYKDRIEQLHLFEENRGGGLGKFLAKEAKGKYIAMMHSDDVWSLDKIKMQVEYMEAHPECGACFTGGACISQEGALMDYTIFNQINMTREQWICYLYKNGNCLAHPSIMARTEIYVELPEKTAAARFRQLPDYWMWLNLLCEKEIHVIEKNLLYFRIHEAGENKNSSAQTTENKARHLVEETYIWYRLISCMKGDLFKRVFNDFMIDKDASSEEDIMCEKMFVLLSPRTHFLKQAGIFYMYDIYENPTVVKLLEEKYNWTKADVARVAGELLS